MAVLRSDCRTRARDYLNESVASLWSDNQLNRYFAEELNSLPSKEIYNESLVESTLAINTTEYTLSSIASGIYKIERIERNDGTSSLTDWVEMKGWDTYGGKLYLSWRPSKEDSIRLFVKKTWTVPTDDLTALEMSDDKTEVVVWGMVCRAYKQLIGYLRGSSSWDTVTKPGDRSIPSIQAWLRDAKAEYKDLIRQYSDVPRPRDIDLVS